MKGEGARHQAPTFARLSGTFWSGLSFSENARGSQHLNIL